MCQTRNKDCTYTIVDKRTLKGEKAARERRLAFEARIKEKQDQSHHLTHQNQHDLHYQHDLGVNDHHEHRQDDYFSPSQSSTSLLNHSPSTPSNGDMSFVGPPPSFPSYLHSVNSAGEHPIAPYMSYIGNTNPLLHYNPGNYQLPGSNFHRLNAYPAPVPPPKKQEFFTVHDLKYSILGFGDSDRFTYVGDCNIATFLKECRNYFEMFIGTSKFTTDILEGEVEEKPVHIANTNSPAMANEPNITIQLPIRYKCDALVENFRKFINISYVTLDLDHFKLDVVDQIYSNPLKSDKAKLSMLYLVLAVGQIMEDYADEDIELKKSYVYFKFGVELVETTVSSDKMWRIQTNYLIFFYCFFTGRKKASYDYLSVAIDTGMKDGFLTKDDSGNSHDKWFRRQLYKSLLISDTICSVLLAKPFVIPPDKRVNAARDFNVNTAALKAAIEADTFVSPAEKDNILRDFCSTELVNIFMIISKIISQVYTGNIIDAESTQETTNELKSWILGLPRSLQVDRYLADVNLVNNDYGHLLVLIHCSQLYAILLLSRPFLLLEMMFKLKPELKSRFRNHQFISTFQQVAIKSSTLALVMIKYYCDVSKRIESILIVEITFFCCLIIGIHLVNGTAENYNDQESIDILKIGLDILLYYSAKNPAADRLSIIIQDMLAAVLQYNDQVKHESKFNDMLSKMLALDTHLSEIDDFQKSFVADEAFSPKPQD